jgi:hypothetical protein
VLPIFLPALRDNGLWDLAEHRTPESMKPWRLKRGLTSDFSSVVEEYSFSLGSAVGFVVRICSRSPAGGRSVSSLPSEFGNASLAHFFLVGKERC